MGQAQNAVSHAAENIPPFITAVTCSPATIITPGSASCIVSASAPAPSQGLTVMTGIGSSSSVTIPSSVVIAAGSTTAAFTAMSSNSTAVLSASLSGTSQSFTLTLAPPPPTVTLLFCTPSSVITPGAATCTVDLSPQAPTGRATVALTGGTANVAIPGSVSVAAGSANRWTHREPSAANANTTAVLSASLNGTSQNFTIPLVPVTLTGIAYTPTTLSSKNGFYMHDHVVG